MLDFWLTPAYFPLLLFAAVWAALLFGGFILGKRWDDGTRRMPVWTRMASSFVLVIAGWYWLLIARETTAVRYALPVAIGMTLGLVGDLFMAKLITRSDQHVLGGIGAFGLGHIAYIVALVGFGDLLGATSYRVPAWLVWLIIGAVGWYVAVYRGQARRSALHYAALPYALLLASTAGFATGLALDDSAFAPLAVGCALFLLSDLLIAARLFNGVFFRLIDDVIWLTYGPAQMLIVFSVGVAVLQSQPLI
jgi:hypothetical protein